MLVRAALQSLRKVNRRHRHPGTVGVDISGFSNVTAHFKRMQERPRIKKLLAYEKEVNEGLPNYCVKQTHNCCSLSGYLESHGDAHFLGALRQVCPWKQRPQRAPQGARPAQIRTGTLSRIIVPHRLWEEFRACLHLPKLIWQSRMRLPVISSSGRSGIKNRSNERLQEPIAGCALHAKTKLF